MSDMTVQDEGDAAQARLAMLLGFLEQDPGNASLRIDAAEAALAARQPERVVDLVRGLDQPAARDVAGRAALARGENEQAESIFATLLQETDAPALRFNLAWARAMRQDFVGALVPLDPATSAALPQAAALEVELLHQLGQFELAEARGRALLELHPEAPQLNAAMSVLALDIDDYALAAKCAARAGTHQDALTTLGTLALVESDGQAAQLLFERALAANPASPRALIGHGLTQLLANNFGQAAEEIDQGAELFDTHLGSWIGAGWAHLLAGDRAKARARFERALAIDPSFGEAQGSFAVLDILDGDVDAGKRRLSVAQRLDRTSASAALGAMLLAAGAGDKERAQAIFSRALATPIDASGRTIGHALARMGIGR